MQAQTNRLIGFAAIPLLALLAAPAPAAAQFGFNEPAPVTIKAVPQNTKAVAGDRFAIAVVLEHEDGWHTWPSAAQDVLAPKFDFAIRTEVGIETKPGWVGGFPTQWPEPHLGAVPDPETGMPAQAPLYSDTAICFIPIAIADDAPSGMVDLHVTYTYQTCNDEMCLPPESDVLHVAFEIAGSRVPVSGADAALFSGFDPKVFAQTPVNGADQEVSSELLKLTAPVARQKLLGWELPNPRSFTGLLVLFIASAIGGAILNLTPCVLPMIPIKIMALSQHAGSRKRAMFLGMWMAIGVVAFWTALGIPGAVIAGAYDPSRLFGYWQVTLGLGLVIAIFGVGCMGLFEFKLPSSVSMLNPKADTPQGSFFYGIMTGVLGLPCFGFVAGGLLAGSAALPASAILAIFIGLGVGMAPPYLLLSAKPELVGWIPRTGPASTLVKQVLGLMMIAAAVFFIGIGVRTLIANYPFLASQLHWWVVALVLVGAALLLVVQTFKITPNPGLRATMLIAGAILGFLSTAWAWSVTNNARLSTGVWAHYTTDSIDAARATGKVVVVDFTADWCVTCKAIKNRVLDPNPVGGRLRDDDVIAIEVDLTSDDAPGWRRLKDLGQSGIPTLVIYGPGLDEPWISNAYTPDMVISAIDRAKAPTGGTATASDLKSDPPDSDQGMVIPTGGGG